MRFWDGHEDARALALQDVEVWAPVHIAPTRYFVSNLGKIMSDVAGRGMREMRPIVGAAGRASVGIYRNAGDRKSESWLLYRLVVWAFDGAPPSPLHTDVCHGITGETDNRLCNLRWGTRRENVADVLLHKRAAVRDRIAARTKHPSPRAWHAGDLPDEDLIARGLTLYGQKLITIEGLAVMWRCSHTAASAVVKGRTQPEQARPARATANGREGDHHHAAVCSDDALRAAFQLYVDNHWSSVQFAAHLGIPQITADSILRGRTRKYLDRPPGFQYPWPDAATMNRRVGEDHGCAKVTSEQILAVFDQIVDGTLTDMQAVQRTLGVARGPAYAIVAGRSWGHLPRPPGLDAAIARIQRGILPPETRAAILADLLAGVARNDVKQKYQLSDSQIAAYVTKANKQRTAGEAP